MTLEQTITTLESSLASLERMDPETNPTAYAFFHDDPDVWSDMNGAIHRLCNILPLKAVDISDRYANAGRYKPIRESINALRGIICVAKAEGAPEADDYIYTASEAAKLANVVPSQIYRMMDDGSLKSEVIGKVKMISDSSFSVYLAQRVKDGHLKAVPKEGTEPVNPDKPTLEEKAKDMKIF